MAICFANHGCATATQTYTPDGSQGYSIDCSGNALTWGKCYEKAGELCGNRGYELVTKTGDEGAVVSGTQYGLFGGSVTTRNMIITCKQ